MRTRTTTPSSTWVTDGTAHGHADQPPAAAAYARDYRAAVLSGAAGGNRVDRAPDAAGGDHVDRGRAPWSPGEPYPLNTFGAGDTAKETLYEYAIRNGFALVTKRSSKRVITLACPQGNENEATVQVASLRLKVFALYEQKRSLQLHDSTSSQ